MGIKSKGQIYQTLLVVLEAENEAGERFLGDVEESGDGWRHFLLCQTPCSVDSKQQS